MQRAVAVEAALATGESSSESFPPIWPGLRRHTGAGVSIVYPSVHHFQT